MNVPTAFGGPPYAAGGAEEFKRAYRRIRAIFEEELVKEGVPLTAISWVFAPNNGSPPENNFELYYPGSDIVDIVGFSGYNQGGCAGDFPWFVWETYDIAIKPYLDRMRAMAPNKPIFLAQTATVEVQAHGQGDKNVWLDDTFTRLAAYPGLKGVVYFNHVDPGNGSCPTGFDFRLHNPGTGQWQGFPTALGRPGVNYGSYGLTSNELLNVVFGRVQQIFEDVLPNHPLLGSAGPPDLSPFIHTLYNSGVTGGCNQSPLRYCPSGTVIRKHMAAFLLRGEHGSGYVPPNPSGVFADVPPADPFAGYVEQLAAEEITTGCGGNNFCPGSVVTREQMAKFLLLAKFGKSYQPPAASGIFTDVPASDPFARFIEALFNLGIAKGCSTSPARFCPDDPVTRAQMAVFLVRTFNL
jgi:hypothetical protein